MAKRKRDDEEEEEEEEEARTRRSPYRFSQLQGDEAYARQLNNAEVAGDRQGAIEWQRQQVLANEAEDAFQARMENWDPTVAGGAAGVSHGAAGVSHGGLSGRGTAQVEEEVAVYQPGRWLPEG